MEILGGVLWACGGMIVGDMTAKGESVISWKFLSAGLLGAAGNALITIF